MNLWPQVNQIPQQTQAHSQHTTHQSSRHIMDIRVLIWDVLKELPFFGRRCGIYSSIRHRAQQPLHVHSSPLPPDVSKYSRTTVHSHNFKCSSTAVMQTCLFAVSSRTIFWKPATISSSFYSVSTSLSRVLSLSRVETVARNLFTDLNNFCVLEHAHKDSWFWILDDTTCGIYRAETRRSVMRSASDTSGTETTSAISGEGVSQNQPRAIR